MGRVFGGATGRPRLVGCAWHTHGRPVEVAAGAGDSVSYSSAWVRAVHGGDRGTCETRSRVALCWVRSVRGGDRGTCRTPVLNNLVRGRAVREGDRGTCETRSRVALSESDLVRRGDHGICRTPVLYSLGWGRAVHGGDRGTCKTWSRARIWRLMRSMGVTVALERLGFVQSVGYGDRVTYRHPRN